MDDESDPEVAADLALRAASERDTTRTRGHGVYGYVQPPTVEHWPCRGGCGVMVAITQEALHAAAVHDRELARRREAPIPRAKCVFCDKCRALGVDIAAERNRKHVDALAELVRELKASPGPGVERERQLIHNIRLMHHPDVDGLVRAIAERRASETGKSRGARKGA